MSAMPQAEVNSGELRFRERLQPLRHGENDKAHQPADQRAVDSNVLQVAPDLQLDPVDQRIGVPPLDHLRRGPDKAWFADDSPPAPALGACCHTADIRV